MAANVYVSIDWLTYTIRPMLPDSDVVDRMRERLRQTHAIWASKRVTARFEPESEPFYRKPYDRRHRLIDGGGSLYFRDSLPYATIEFSGSGCQRLQKATELERILEMHVQDVTRFDIAIDIRTDTRPRDFIKAGFSSRIKTHNTAISPSGETVYLGSPQSDIMARVYRYESPHPRHEFLRIEFQLRRDRAKQMARIWLTDGPIAAAQHAAHSFQFAHPDWDLGHAKAEGLPTQTRSDSKTMAWMIKQVRPAMIRLITENAASPSWWHEFFEGIPHCAYSEREQPPEYWTGQESDPPALPTE